MRKSRVIAFALAALVSGASMVEAQGRADRAPRGERAMGRTGHGQADSRGLLRGVALSEAEKTSIKAINEKYRAQGQELRGATRPAREEMREKARALMEQRRTELRAALTAENQKTFDANAKEMQSRRAEWAKKRRDGRN